MNSNSKSVRVAIVGASGYSGEELVRLLLRHPHVELVAVTSRQSAGQTIAQVFPKFAMHPVARTLKFSDPDTTTLAQQAEIVFLALPHGVAAEFAIPLLRSGCRVIDLSADFRLKSAAVYKEFYAHDHPAPELLTQSVYGLPEVHGEAIRGARLVASPGCYPTSILLPTLPLLRDGLIRPTGIIADSMSGVSGAGKKVEEAFLFCERAESAKAYGLVKHRHLAEVEEQLALHTGAPTIIQFNPHLAPMRRGIATTITVPAAPGATVEHVYAAWRQAYAQAPFVQILPAGETPDTAHVVGTNRIDISAVHDPRTGNFVITSAEDNLMKGASGQAVQIMNLWFRFEETAGLV
jgi:N-acetyl-gamma-glutamyl-phosphate reductase